MTGTRSCPDHGPELIRSAFRDLGATVELVVTGGAYGVDTAAYRIAREEFDGAEHRIFAPSGLHHNRRLTAEAEREMVAGGPVAVEWFTKRGRTSAYLVRDHAMVDMVAEDGVLLAFPRTPVEQRRGSGTWATIRYARKVGVPVIMVPLFLRSFD